VPRERSRADLVDECTVAVDRVGADQDEARAVERSTSVPVLEDPRGQPYLEQRLRETGAFAAGLASKASNLSRPFGAPERGERAAHRLAPAERDDDRGGRNRSTRGPHRGADLPRETPTLADDSATEPRLSLANGTAPDALGVEPVSQANEGAHRRLNRPKRPRPPGQTPVERPRAHPGGRREVSFEQSERPASQVVRPVGSVEGQFRPRGCCPGRPRHREPRPPVSSSRRRSRRGLASHRDSAERSVHQVPIRVPPGARGERVFPPALAGRTELVRFRSRVLEGNPLGDPVEREVAVYTPPSGRTEGRPLIVLLSGYTGAGWMHFQRARFLRENLIDRIDRLQRSGQCAEAVVVAPDCLTTLGGSQYLNSSATGRYEDHVIDEIVPWARERYRIGPVALCGTSSGGYGSVVLALRHPEVVRAFASNAGDMAFEYGYMSDFPKAVRQLRRSGGPEAFLSRYLNEPVATVSWDNPVAVTLEVMGYASSYSPTPGEPGAFDLPFDWETGRLVPEVWNRWLALDPVRMIEESRYREALGSLALAYVDGGTRDEFFLDVGARRFADTASRHGIRVRHEEFEGSHGEGGPRYDLFVPLLVEALGFPPPKRGTDPTKVQEPNGPSPG
jgi:pimeloyl-ACP methyl ester carboxylesterase